MTLLLQQNKFLHKLYFSKSQFDKTLLLSCGFSLLLLFTRIIYTGDFTFYFLTWNLFLAYLPYKIGGSIMRRPQVIESQFKFWLLFVGWLLLLPNTFYILTDLFHLHKGGAMPQWFDLALIISFAWNGLLFGVASIKRMELVLKLKLNLQKEWVYLYPVMFLNALGIYIGRYMRFNSWDVISAPFDLAKEVWFLILHPVQNRFDWSMIICYSFLLLLFYSTVKRLSEPV